MCTGVGKYQHAHDTEGPTPMCLVSGPHDCASTEAVRAVVLPIGKPAYGTELSANVGGVIGELLGGWLEGVYFAGAAHGYVDEDGIRKGLGYNRLATELLASHGRNGMYRGVEIRGPMVLLGDGPRDGMEHDVPPWVYGFVGLKAPAVKARNPELFVQDEADAEGGKR